MDRKELVRVLSKHLGIKAKYLGVPSFAYEIGDFTVTREGKIKNKVGDEMTLDQITRPTLEDEFDQIEIAFPLEGHNARSIRNLLNMVYSKESLIKKAYGLEDSIVEKELIDKISGLESLDELLSLINENNCKGISFKDEKISFNFIKGDITISSEFLNLLINKSKELKHTSSRQVETDNDKYSFRTWLIRLEMVGPAYKDHRKILLSKLDGSSAFRNRLPKDQEA